MNHSNEQPNWLLELSMQTPWLHSRGESSLNESDQLPLTLGDSAVPYLAGTHIKGVLRSAMLEAEAFEHIETGRTEALFGGRGDSSTAGLLDIGNAVPNPRLVQKVVAEPQSTQKMLAALTNTSSHATIDRLTGVTATNKLFDLTSVAPLTLYAEISAPELAADEAGRVQRELEIGLLLMGSLGSKRSRDMGAVVGTLHPLPANGHSSLAVEPSQTEIWVKMSASSDFFISARSATEGEHQTLDYVPGASLLGALQNHYYQSAKAQDSEQLWALFNSGQLQISDALPIGQDGRVGCPVPRSWHYAKHSNQAPITEGFIEPAAIKDLSQDGQSFAADAQPKPLPEGYVTDAGHFFQMDRKRVGKTAHDEGRNIKADGQLYQRESVSLSSRDFVFKLSVTESLRGEFPALLDALMAQRSFGGKRKTGFGGRFALNLCDKPQGWPEHGARQAGGKQWVCLLADTALTDSNTGLPTTAPTAQQFGLGEGAFIAEQSHVRHGTRARYNSYKKAFLSDLPVLKRGSVLCFESDAEPPTHNATGLMTEGGLGCFAVNPAYLSVCSQAEIEPTSRAAELTQLASIEEHPFWQRFADRIDAVSTLEQPPAQQAEAVLQYLKRQMNASEPELSDKQKAKIKAWHQEYRKLANTAAQTNRELEKTEPNTGQWLAVEQFARAQRHIDNDTPLADRLAINAAGSPCIAPVWECKGFVNDRHTHYLQWLQTQLRELGKEHGLNHAQQAHALERFAGQQARTQPEKTNKKEGR